MESMWRCVESMGECMESMVECMESMVECMESIVEFMKQKHSTWNPPGMWGQGKVLLAGDPKVFRLLCNTNLNMNIPSRGSKEERIRILLRVWANIQSRRYNK